MIRKMIPGALLILSLLVLGSCGTQQVGATGAQATATATAPAPAPKGPPADIPIYPGATLQQQHSASFNGTMIDFWMYMASGPNLTSTDVINFYQQQMPANGWTPMQTVPKNSKGAALLTYQMQPMMGTPMPGHGHMHRMAIIAVGANSEAHPPQIGFVITEVR
jgi:hypothetical protein